MLLPTAWRLYRSLTKYSWVYGILGPVKKADNIFAQLKQALCGEGLA